MADQIENACRLIEYIQWRCVTKSTKVWDREALGKVVFCFLGAPYRLLRHPAGWFCSGNASCKVSVLELHGDTYSESCCRSWWRLRSPYTLILSGHPSSVPIVKTLFRNNLLHTKGESTQGRLGWSHSTTQSPFILWGFIHCFIGSFGLAWISMDIWFHVASNCCMCVWLDRDLQGVCQSYFLFD